MPRCRHWKRQASKIIADVKICKTHNHCIQFFLKEGYFLKGIWILIYYLREFTVTYQHLSFFLSSLITMTRSIRISSTDLCPELHTHVYTDFWTCSCRSHTLNKSKISLFILPRKLLHGLLASDRDSRPPCCPNQNPEGRSWLLSLSHPHIQSLNLTELTLLLNKLSFLFISLQPPHPTPATYSSLGHRNLSSRLLQEPPHWSFSVSNLTPLCSAHCNQSEPPIRKFCACHSDSLLT